MGSVFTEFAMVMPIALLICSALFEVIGFWDAQVMANHTAWQVGRIAMVRGSDGMAFGSKRSKTGVTSKAMPSVLKTALTSFESAFGSKDRFNNRGNIAAAFMMSTCGIGYFGVDSGDKSAASLDQLVQQSIDAIAEGLATCTSKAVADAIGDFAKAAVHIDDSNSKGLEKIIYGVVNKTMGKIVDAALKPVKSALEDLLGNLYKSIFDALKIKNLFTGPRVGRQLFGAITRIAAAPSAMGQEAVVVVDMTNDVRFVFADNAPLYGRLAYPGVADSAASSDGYFVAGAHGWPPNKQAHAMVHVAVNWPYERSWMFPVVSGYGARTEKPVVAKGHSMVFPQPCIIAENLRSEGATAFDPGSYEEPKDSPSQLASEMERYIRVAQFCMKFRICEEEEDLDTHRRLSHNIPRVNPLYDLLGYGDDYRRSVEDLASAAKWHYLLYDYYSYNRLVPSAYHNLDYFHWLGDCHCSYHTDIIDSEGVRLRTSGVASSDLGSFYDAKEHAGHCYKDDRKNCYNGNAGFYKVYNEFALYDMAWGGFRPILTNNWQKLDRSTLHSVAYDERKQLKATLNAFCERNKLNVSNLCRWQTTTNADFVAWIAIDKALEAKAKKLEGKFPQIKKFVESEIAEIQTALDNKGKDSGYSDVPLFDEDDQKMLLDPEAAAGDATENWKIKKEQLKSKLEELDGAVVDLRNAWSDYKTNAVGMIRRRQDECMGPRFVRACLEILKDTQDITIFDEGRFDDFLVQFRRRQIQEAFGCSIAGDTKRMLETAMDYDEKLEAAYRLEVEYGTLLGIKGAEKRKEEGKSLEDIVKDGDFGDESGKGPGTSGGDDSRLPKPGSDDDGIIRHDTQTFKGGWKWKINGSEVGQ